MGTGQGKQAGEQASEQTRKQHSQTKRHRESIGYARLACIDRTDRPKITENGTVRKQVPILQEVLECMSRPSDRIFPLCFFAAIDLVFRSARAPSACSFSNLRSVSRPSYRSPPLANSLTVLPFLVDRRSFNLIPGSSPLILIFFPGFCFSFFPLLSLHSL